MPDSFDQNAAATQRNEIINEAGRIRDGLTSDVINYYYNPPTTEDQERDQNAGLRKYLEIARDRINDLLSRQF